MLTVVMVVRSVEGGRRRGRRRQALGVRQRVVARPSACANQHRHLTAKPRLTARDTLRANIRGQ